MKLCFAQLQLIAAAVAVAQPTIPLGLPVREVPVIQISTPPPETIPRLLETRNQYYGVYETTSGAKLGWYSSQQHTATLDKNPTICFTNRSKFYFLHSGESRANYLEEEFHFSRTAPFRLLLMQLLETKSGSRREITLRQHTADPSRYRASITEGKETRHESLVGLQLTALDQLAASTWARSPKRQPGQQLRVAALDIRELVPYVERFTILPTDPARPQQTMVNCEDLKDGDLSNFTYDAKGLLCGANIGGVTILRPEPQELALAVPQPVDLFQQSLVPCDRPLGRILDLKQLSLTLTGPAAAGIPETSRQRIVSRREGQWDITLGQHQGLPRLATPEDREAALQGSASLPISHPKVIALAREAIGSAQTNQVKVAQLVQFVKNYLKDDPAAEPLSLLDILRQRRGDCTEHTLLFTALARAAHIPCREVTGYLYLGDAEQAFAGHAWNEVELNGRWEEVDATWGLTTVTPGHILLSSGKATLSEMRFLTGGNTISVRDEP